jgi:hypothetical protein
LRNVEGSLGTLPYPFQGLPDLHRRLRRPTSLIVLNPLSLAVSIDMRRFLATFLAGSALALAASGPVAAAGQLLEYRIKHPTFGDIGRYSNRIESVGPDVIVTSELDVTVKILGLTAHREQSLRREQWRDGRLVAFTGTTTKNGERSEIRGEARDGGFQVTTPSGTVMAPANVRPSNPWSADLLQSGPLLSTRDGALLSARVTLAAEETAMRGGRPEPLYRFVIESDKSEYVWLDTQGVPVAFRTQENGTAIDFVLVRDEAGPVQTAEVPR